MVIKNFINNVKATALNAVANLSGQLEKRLKQVVGIYARVVTRSQSIIAPTIEEWKNAIYSAKNPASQRWAYLQEMYEKAMLNDVVYSAIDLRLKRIEREYYTLTDKQGNDITHYLNGSWFNDFKKYTVESNFYGFTVVEITTKDGKPVVELIPRAHLAPLAGGINMASPTSGLLVYRDTELEKVLIEIGKPTDLGSLHILTLATIYFKHALEEWAEFISLFGKPLRIGKVFSRNDEARQKMASNLDAMGSSAWAVIDQEESVEFIESTKTDAFNVYDKMMSRMERAIHRIILGQTSLTEEKAFVGAAKVSQGIANDILVADKKLIERVVNEDLLPRLIAFGWKELEGASFQMDERIEITELDLKIDEFLIANFGFENLEYFEGKYGVKLLDKAKENETNTDKNTLSISAEYERLSAEVHDIYSHGHNH